MKNNPTNPGDEKMSAAYKLSSQLVRDRLIQEDKTNADLLEDIDSSDIIVVTGTYDHIHLVLKHSGLPFKEVIPHQLAEIKLRPDQTVFVNCASSFPPEAARQLAGFVSAGGQLITTDWALQNVLEVGFPGYVEYNRRPSADEVIRIEILEKEDPILRGFLDEEKDTKPVWWLEGSSYPIKILDREKVKVMIRSKELKEKYGEDAVIVNFKHGEGEVYHMISHFYLQRTETRDKKQTSAASSYASAKGASANTIDMMKQAEESISGFDYGTVQSAATSSEFINRALLKQKKKFSRK